MWNFSRLKYIDGTNYCAAAPSSQCHSFTCSFTCNRSEPPPVFPASLDWVHPLTEAPTVCSEPPHRQASAIIEGGPSSLVLPAPIGRVHLHDASTFAARKGSTGTTFLPARVSPQRHSTRRLDMPQLWNHELRSQRPTICLLVRQVQGRVPIPIKL